MPQSVAMTERIYLVGFMGAGKTTVGRLVAAGLGWSFVDLDEEIERSEGKPVSEIFRDSGEPYFRKIERIQLGEVAQRTHCVIALGGGTYADGWNRDLVEKTGHSVYLDTPLELIEDRIVRDGLRPLFSKGVDIAALYTQRQPSYRMAATTVDTRGLSPQEIADRVIQDTSLL
jgi:shikimate kinase